MIPRRLRRGGQEPRTFLKVDPGITLTPELAGSLREAWRKAMRSRGPVVISGVEVIQIPRGKRFARPS